MAALILVGVVDRVEGSWAVVEWWPSAETRDVALGALPPRVREGQQILLVARANDRGHSMVTHDPDGSRLVTPRGAIGLPSDAPLPIDQIYRVRIRRHRGAARPQTQGRAHPRMGTREHGGMDPPLIPGERARSWEPTAEGS